MSEGENILRLFLKAAIELEAHKDDIVSVQAVAEHTGLGEQLSEKLMELHIQRRNLVRDPDTEEPGNFRVTQKGRRKFT